MKIQKHLFSTRLWIALFVLFGAMSFSAYAQKDILLYSTDFTDWGAMNESSAGSDDVFNATGGGAGFVLGSKPTVDPTGAACGGTGFIRNNSDSNLKLKFPEFNFVSGGAVELWLCAMTTSNTRQVIIPGADAVMIEGPVPTPSSNRYDRIGIGTGTTINTSMMGGNNTTLDNTKVGVYFPGDSWISSGGSTYYKVTYRLPAATFTGLKTIQLGSSDWHKDIAICAIKIYTGVGTVVPYVASTNYPKAPADGHVMQGLVGGAVNSGTAVNDPIKIKGWNLSGADVILSIEGKDATKFSLTGAATDGTLTVPNATALLGYDVPLQFTPSVHEGVSSALLKIEAAGCSPYYVSLTGITGGGTTPKILASSAVIPFYTSVIETVSKTLSLTGVNLTGDVAVSFEGSGKEQFSVPLGEDVISKANATAGYTLTIKFKGTNDPSELENIFLVLKSPGADDVRIPLYGITRDVNPPLYDLIFEVNPSGSAYLDLSLVGPKYEQGTTVEVKVEPEKGYALYYWSDNAGSRSKSRTFRVTANKSVTIFMKKIATEEEEEENADYVAYTPSNITNDGFTAKWSSAPDATGYTVVIYDKNKTEIARIPAGTANSLNVSGLAPSSPQELSDFFYYFEVEATVPAGTEKTTMIGPIRLNGTILFNCGD
jgi:hypothetical protein